MGQKFRDHNYGGYCNHKFDKKTPPIFSTWEDGWSGEEGWGINYNNLICIFLFRHWNRNYIFFFLYHQNSFLQIHHNSIYICHRCFPNVFTHLHLLLNNLTSSQCNNILNIHLYLLSHHPCPQISFIHDTSHAICKFNWSLLICCSFFILFQMCI